MKLMFSFILAMCHCIFLETPPPPLSEGLDPPLIFHNKVFLLVKFRDVANAFYLKIDESSYSTKT